MKISHIQLLLAAAVFSPMAGAAPMCLGTNGTVTACVDPDRISTTPTHIYDDCVHTLGPPDQCTPVSVDAPIPRFGPGAATIDCGLEACNRIQIDCQLTNSCD